MKQNSWYCPQPFKHVFVYSHGISCCCKISRQNTSLDKWSQNEQLQQIQKNTLAGTIPVECGDCHRDEQAGITSLRQTSLSEYDNKIFDSLEIDFIDYRYSNLCNFKCRSCSQEFSHQIVQEVSQNPSLQQFYGLPFKKKLVSVNDHNIQWIKDHLKQIKRLMFTGGEPTVIPEVRTIIESILSDRSLETSILITSNCSFDDDFWYDLVNHLPNRLHWTASIDSVGKHSEIIRNGTIWPVVQKNIEWLASNAESLNVNTVISNMNLFQLRPLLRFVRNCQLNSIFPTGKHGSQGLKHQWVVAYDDKISAVNWPPELRLTAIQYLESCQDLDLDDSQREMLVSMQRQIKNHHFNQSHWDLSHQFHTALDTIRNENHNDLFELQN